MTLDGRVPSALSGAYPVRSGNLVRPLVDGVPAFRRIAEAIGAARHSLWLTVAFYAPDFRFPDGRGLFDVLDDAVARGQDVRVLFWRPNAESSRYGRAFSGTSADREFLTARRSRVSIRWDRAGTAYCHHQKSWLIDAGHPTETAFVGGVNLTAKALGLPGHQNGGQHDVYGQNARTVWNVQISGQSWNTDTSKLKRAGHFG